MAKLTYIHPPDVIANWSKQPWYMQIGNVGSEVGRAIKYQKMGQAALAEKAFVRSLELFDLTIDAAVEYDRVHHTAHLKEFCRAREEWCDYFTGSHEYGSSAEQIERYYTQFASLRFGK